MAPHSSSSDDVGEWLRDHFITSFEHDVSPSYWPQLPNECGMFAIPLLCLCYCNAMAALVLGKSKAGSQETIGFIVDYLGRNGAASAARYRARAAGLYTLFRHGLIHQREPGGIQIDATSSLSWILERGGFREDHLRMYPPGAVCYPDALALPPGTFALRASADYLYEDVLSALNYAHQMVSTDSKLVTLIFKGANAMAGVRKLENPSPTLLKVLGQMIATHDQL